MYADKPRFIDTRSANCQDDSNHRFGGLTEERLEEQILPSNMTLNKRMTTY